MRSGASAYVLYVIALLVAVMLWSTPLLQVGNTAITDTVFLWGVDGLSFWSHDPVNEWLSRLQLAASSLLFLALALALYPPRSLAWLRWLASLLLAIAASASIAHALRVAPSTAALLPHPHGIGLLLALLFLLPASAAGGRRATPKRAPPDALLRARSPGSARRLVRRGSAEAPVPAKPAGRSR